MKDHISRTKFQNLLCRWPMWIQIFVSFY